MAITPNYSWPLPDDTSLVKDGAQAIRDLGNAIDNTVENLPSGALVHIVTSTTTGVISVNVENCFSATFDNYKVLIRATHSGSLSFSLRLLDGSTPATGANYQRNGANFGASIINSPGTGDTSWNRSGSATVHWAEIELTAPFLAEETRGLYRQQDSSTLRVFGLRNTLTTSFDGLQYFLPSGTITSLTFSVYGYAKA